LTLAVDGEAVVNGSGVCLRDWHRRATRVENGVEDRCSACRGKGVEERLQQRRGESGNSETADSMSVGPSASSIEEEWNAQKAHSLALIRDDVRIRFKAVDRNIL